MIKRTNTKRIAFLCALVFIASVLASACSVLPEGAELPTPTPEQYTEEQLNTPVITIGEYVVTFGEYLNFFNNVAAFYRQNYNFDITEDPETLAQYKEKITQTLAQEAAALQGRRAWLNGFDRGAVKGNRREISEQSKRNVRVLYCAC